MRDEERIYKDTPQIIDVEVEPDIDFELREPEDEIDNEATYEEKEKIIEVESVYEEQINDNQEEPVRDTSFTTFKANQQVGEKRWRKKIWHKFKKLTFVLVSLLVGIPLLGFGGFFGVVGIGMAAFFCALGFGMGILGVGISAFLMTAEMAAIGAVILFVSLMGIGGGGFGLLLLLAIIIGIKNLIVKCYGYMRRRMTQEVQ